MFISEGSLRPTRSYFVCCAPRSGSTLLCEALYNTGVAGHPEEYFEARPRATVRDPVWEVERRVLPAEQFIERIYEYGSTPNGVFGAKLQPWHLPELGGIRTLPRYRDMPLFEILDCLFPNPRYVWITRRDKIRQAVSNYRAVLTDVWTEKQDQTPCQPNGLVFNFQLIDSILRSILKQEAAWAALFSEAGIAPLTVTYEDLVLDYLPTVRRALDYLDVKAPVDLRLPSPSLSKQADEISEEWVHLYYHHERQRNVWQTALNLPSVMLQPGLYRPYLRPALRRWMTRLLSSHRPTLSIEQLCGPFGHRSGAEPTQAID